MIEHARMMAAYNAWANRRLYASAASLPDDEYRADRGVFFRSMEGTLNHLVVTDRIWMRRLSGEGEATKVLSAIPYDTLPALDEARRAEDRRIIAWIDRLDETALGEKIRYERASTNEVFEQVRGPALMHLFNHQTHHRGQAHAILTGLGHAAPELDLLYYQREAGL